MKGSTPVAVALPPVDQRFTPKSDISFPVDLRAESQIPPPESVQGAAIKLTLRFGEANRNLIVVVSEVVNLTKMTAGQNGNHSYYVSITSFPFKTKRRTREFVGDPDKQSYEETLEFPVDNEILLKTAYLEVKIKTKTGAFSKDALAQVLVPLENVIGISSHTAWYNLEEPDHK